MLRGKFFFFFFFFFFFAGYERFGCKGYGVCGGGEGSKGFVLGTCFWWGVWMRGWELEGGGREDMWVGGGGP